MKTGSSARDPDHLKRFSEPWKRRGSTVKTVFTEAEITLYYGASELSYVTYIRDTQMNDDKTRIGRPFPGIDVQLEDGRLMVNTKWGVIGTGKEASAGDYAHLDEEGYFVLMAERMIFAVLMARRSPVSV